MPQKRTTELFFALLRCSVLGTPLPQDFAPTESEWSRIRAIAARHHMLHLVEYAAQRGTEATDCVLVRYFRQEELTVRIFSVLAAANIPYMPLKGLILRGFYPKPWMRIGNDIDLLVPSESLQEAVRLLTDTVGLKVHDSNDAHEVHLLSADNTIIELHHTLILPGEFPRASAALSQVWDKVVPVGDGSYSMPEEYSYLYHIAHMMKHFRNGGCGVRFFLDLYLMAQQDGHDDAKCHALAEQCGMLSFALASERLAQAWFTGTAVPDELSAYADFVTGGGLFGSRSGFVTAWQTDDLSHSRYLLSRIFSAYEKQQPYVQKHPWLLPVAWFRRFLRLCDPKTRRRIRSELRSSRQVEVSEVSAFGELKRVLGFAEAKREWISR